MPLIAWFMLVLLAILWGSAYIFIEVALKSFSPMTMVMVRLWLAALMITVFVYARGEKLPFTGRAWAGFIFLGFIQNSIPYSLIGWGQVQIEASIAAILNAFTPVFTVLLAHFLTHDERLRPLKVMGIMMGFIGVYVIILPNIGADTDIGFAGLNMQGLGQLAVLCATLCYAIGTVMSKRIVSGSVFVSTAGLLIGASLTITPMAFIFEQPLAHQPTLEGWMAIAGLALIGSVLAFILFYKVLSLAGATGAILVMYIIPVVVLIMGAVFLNEQVNLYSLAGMVIIFIGLSLIDGRIYKKLRKKRATP